MSKFKVLWIDDQPQKVGMEIDTVSSIIKNHGFEPIIFTLDKVTEADFSGENSDSKLKSREYDLLFIDYHLCNNILGSQIISEIRSNNNIYVDIVFYSSDKERLVEAVKSSFDGPLLGFLDDIHIVVLDDSDFDEKIEHVIEKVISSWYNAHSIRGIIMAKASKFENMVNEIIKKYYLPHLEPLCSELENKKINAIKAMTEKWEGLAKESDQIKYVTEHPEKFNWNVRKKLFETLATLSAISIEDKQFAQNLEHIFKIRNDFAHNKAKIVNGSLILHTPKGDRLYDEDTISLFREEINSVELVLEKLLTDTQ